jgi:lysophospholipase L1-like esterase
MQKTISVSNIPGRGGNTALKKVFFVILITVIGICLIVAALEIGLRIFLKDGPPLTWDPLLVQSDIKGLKYRLAPNFHKNGIRINAEGLLWRPADPEPPKKKVLIIGDSVSFGSDVSQEQNFAVLLEQKLRESLGWPIAVWNAGTPGYNTTQEELLLKDIGPGLNPDLVIVQLCLNDYEPSMIVNARNVLERKGEVESNNKASGFPSWLLPGKAILFLKHHIKSLQKMHPEWFPVWAHYIHHVGRKPGWKEVKESLLSIRDWADHRNSAFLLVLFPFEQQLRIQDAAIQRNIAKFAKAEGIHCLDLYYSFEQRWRDRLFIDYSATHHLADKVHLSSKGHALAAQEIASIIQGDSHYYLNLR